jgi:hypothetical protein
MSFPAAPYITDGSTSILLKHWKVVPRTWQGPLGHAWTASKPFLEVAMHMQPQAQELGELQMEHPYLGVFVTREHVRHIYATTAVLLGFEHLRLQHRHSTPALPTQQGTQGNSVPAYVEVVDKQTMLFMPLLAA